MDQTKELEWSDRMGVLLLSNENFSNGPNTTYWRVWSLIDLYWLNIHNSMPVTDQQIMTIKWSYNHIALKIYTDELWWFAILQRKTRSKGGYALWGLFRFFKIGTFSSQHFQLTALSNNEMHLNVLAFLQDANVVINSPEQFYSKRYDRDSLKTWFHIVQLQWLGFDYDKRDNVTAIEEFISWIIPQ